MARAVPTPDQPSILVERDNSGIISTGDRAFNILINLHAGGDSAADALAELTRRIVLEARNERSPAEQDPLTKKADELTASVLSRLRREVEQLRLEDRDSLPVSWRPISWDEPGNGRGSLETPNGIRGVPLSGLAGPLGRATKEFRWLMVLGRAGAGKSVLALQFAKSLLEKRSRDRDGPVPVIFSLGSWNPGTSTLRNWLIGRLERDYSFLAAIGPGPEGDSWAAELVDGGNYVLPILDGFDEIAADDDLRGKAVTEFNSSNLSLVVTSRREAIETVKDKSNIKPSAAAIELIDLGLDDSVRYLYRATGTSPADGTDVAHRVGWPYVLRELSRRPHTRASHDLATVLATPLMTTLARFAYESRLPGHDPSDLLDSEKFGTQDALERHLLDFFVRTAYERLLGSKPTKGAEGRVQAPRWDVERVRLWLGYLAVHLTKLDTSDIEWWRLGTAMKLRWVTLRVGVTIGIACGLMAGLVYGSETAVGYGLLNGIVAAGITGLTNGTAMGLTFGLMHGFVTKMKAGGPMFEPSRVEIRIHSWTDLETRTRLRENFLPRARGGLMRRSPLRALVGRGRHRLQRVLGLPLVHDRAVRGAAARDSDRPGAPAGPRRCSRGRVRDGHPEKGTRLPVGPAGHEPCHRAQTDHHRRARDRSRVRNPVRALGEQLLLRGPGRTRGRLHGRARGRHDDRLGTLSGPRPDLAPLDGAAAEGPGRLSAGRLRAGSSAPGRRGLPVPPRTTPGAPEQRSRALRLSRRPVGSFAEPAESPGTTRVRTSGRHSENSA